MKRSRLFRVLVTVISWLLATYNVPAQSKQVTIYYSPVDISAMPWPEYYKSMDSKLVAEDLANLLQQACNGWQFRVAPFQQQLGPGIYLLLADNARAGQEEVCQVQGDGRSQLRFTANYLTGLSYGVYSYLDQLGFRFYLPGSDWQHIPQLASPFSNQIRQARYQPSFRLRMFTPSGAMPRVKGLDEQGLLEKEWHAWYRRNRMGSAHLVLGGHVGESFNLENRAALEADLSMLAPFNGKRQFHIGAKLDPTNPRGIVLFESWILKKKAQHDKIVAPVFPRQRFESVDPADGYDYCQTPECKAQFPSISDQVFYIANRCADRVKAEDPGRGVSLYAYADKADTPRLTLRPNVHVSMVATGFQSIDIPVGIVERWKRKTRQLSVYDYLNIGVWSYDQPFYNLYNYLPFLSYLQRQQIDGLSYETSSSALGSGVLQYFILRFLNRPYGNVSTEIDRFCRDNFGPAAVPMRKLFDLWYGNDKYIQTMFDRPVSTADDLGRMFRWLDEAVNTTGLTDKHRRRLEDLQIFTGYLSLQHEFWSDASVRGRIVKEPAFKQQRLEEILQYTWSQYWRGIFHNTELTNHLRNQLPNQTDYRNRWDYYKSPETYNRYLQPSTTWKSVYEEKRRKYLPLGIPVGTVTDAQLAQLTKLAADSVVFETVDEKAFGSIRYALPVYCNDPSKPIEIQFRYQASERAETQSNQIGFVAINSRDFRYLDRRFIRVNQRTGTLRFRLPARGHYTLTLSQQQGTPAQWVIRTQRSHLLYVNKAILPVQGIVLSGRESQKKTANAWVAVMAPVSDTLRFQLLYPDSYNTTEIQNAQGEKLKPQPVAGTGIVEIPMTRANKTTFLYLRNSLHRWGTTLINTAPFYFFLQPPKEK